MWRALCTLKGLPHPGIRFLMVGMTMCESLWGLLKNLLCFRYAGAEVGRTGTRLDVRAATTVASHHARHVVEVAQLSQSL